METTTTTQIKSNFVHLHSHSDYSTLDGMCKIPDLVKRANEYGMKSLALSDHGTLAGVLEFYQSAKSEGIKPIIGCEVYCVPDMSVKKDRTMYHLVLLAKDEQGYHNLIKISSEGYLKGFYHKPRVDLDLISKYSKGLIAMTACIAGYVPAMIIKGEVLKAEAELLRLKGIFGSDLYIEIMDHGLTDQGLANPTLIEFGKKFDIPIVATNDTHYLNADDYTAHDVLLCVQTQRKLADAGRFRFSSDQYYFKTQAYMSKIFPLEYLTRTLEVAEKCNLELDLRTSHLPQFITPDGSSPDDYLWGRIQDGIQRRFNGTVNQAYRERINKEYTIIKKQGFSSYFLIIDDLIQYTRKQGIRFGPRGSVIASVVSYLLGIIDIDPIKHDLLFERFLTEDRISLPDIDIDFRHDRRDDVINYLRNKYGYVTQISTFNKLSPRSIVRNVGRVLDTDKSLIDHVAKSIPQNLEETLKKSERTLSALRSEIFELSDLGTEFINVGTKLHGIIRHAGRHPAGTVICDQPISNIIPLRTFNGIEMTQYDKDGVEASGLLKIDILGNRYLTIVDRAMDSIESIHGYRPDITDFDDPDTYDLICSGDTSGIFQLGQDCIGSLVKEIRPRNFNEIVHVLCLGRPGVLDSGMVVEYITSRAIGDNQYLHPTLEPILKDTFGIIIYQEQVMSIGVNIAGFSWKESEKLRKAISKQEKDRLNSLKDSFISGCVSNSLPETTARELWNQVQYFGGYGFNKAHAIGYAMLTYLTAYLKAHYPREYFSALLSIRGDDEDELKKYIYEAKRKGIKILNPDINLSSDRCNIVSNSIYLPLTFIKGIGTVACEEILRERSNGNFKSYNDFCKRIAKQKVNKRVREKLIVSGAFDGIEDRQKLLSENQDTSDTEIMTKEKEALRTCLSEHLLDDSWYDSGILHINEIANLSLKDKFVTIGFIEKVHEHYDKRGRLMAFIILADNTGQLDSVVFADDYACPLTEGDLILLTAKLDGYEPLKSIATKFDLLSNPNVNQVV
jgi:DNA polymerase-3 subunit alpha